MAPRQTLPTGGAKPPRFRGRYERATHSAYFTTSNRPAQRPARPAADAPRLRVSETEWVGIDEGTFARRIKKLTGSETVPVLPSDIARAIRERARPNQG